MARPQLKTKTVEYWSCNNPKHHHKTYGVAERCMEKHPHKKIDRKIRWTKKERLKLANMLITYGMSYREASNVVGVSAARATQVMSNTLRKANANACRAGCDTRYEYDIANLRLNAPDVMSHLDMYYDPDLYSVE